jgi:hypothetical protein
LAAAVCADWIKPRERSVNFSKSIYTLLDQASGPTPGPPWEQPDFSGNPLGFHEKYIGARPSGYKSRPKRRMEKERRNAARQRTVPTDSRGTAAGMQWPQ